MSHAVSAALGQPVAYNHLQYRGGALSGIVDVADVAGFEAALRTAYDALASCSATTSSAWSSTSPGARRPLSPSPRTSSACRCHPAATTSPSTSADRSAHLGGRSSQPSGNPLRRLGYPPRLMRASRHSPDEESQRDQHRGDPVQPAQGGPALRTPRRARGTTRTSRRRRTRGPTRTRRRSGPSRPSGCTGTGSGTRSSTGRTRRSRSGSSAAPSTRRTTASTGTSTPGSVTGSRCTGWASRTTTPAR